MTNNTTDQDDLLVQEVVDRLLDFQVDSWKSNLASKVDGTVPDPLEKAMMKSLRDNADFYEELERATIESLVKQCLAQEFGLGMRK